MTKSSPAAPLDKSDPASRFRDGVGVSSTAAMVASFEALPETERGAVALSPLAREVAERFSDKPVSQILLVGLVRVFEFAMLLAIGLGVYLSYVDQDLGFDWTYAIPLVGGSLLAVLLIQAADGYQVSAFRTYVSQLGRIFTAWTIVFGFFATVTFFAKLGESYSRVWFATWYAGGLFFFVGFRVMLAAFVRRWTRDGRLERRAVLVGGGRNAEELILALEAQSDNDIRICGIFDDRNDERSPSIVAGYPKLGTIPELVEFGRISRLDMLIVSLPLSAEQRVLEMVKKLWVLPVDIRLSAHTNKLRFRPRAYSYVGNLPFLDIFDKPLADWDALVKRAFDLLVGGLALILLFPVMVLTAIAIKLDSHGPVFFRQKRFGFNNEVIDVWKFRSMYSDKTDSEARKIVTKNDPRVTGVGRFIRKTSIDELPQLFNVLAGELSLVGPRPHAVNAQTHNRLWDAVVDGYFARHKVKPGVTGWAQVNGWRGEVDKPEKIRRRVEYDLYYIDNWSVAFDIYILALTPVRLLHSENAY